MLWPDEVREPEFDILDAEVDLRPQELTMAASLVESLGADFDPSQFHDEYRDAVVELIERKRTTGESRPAPVAEKPTDEGDSMTDLLSALQASVEAARAVAPAARDRRNRGREKRAPAKEPAARKSSKKSDDQATSPPRAAAPANRPDAPTRPRRRARGGSGAEAGVRRALSLARALNSWPARFLSQFTTPSRTGTVVEIPSPSPRMAKPSCGQVPHVVPSSTAIEPDSPVASGTSRNGLSSTDGLVTLSSRAEMNARCRSTRPKSDDAVARVRTYPSAVALSRVWQPFLMSSAAFGSLIDSGTHMYTPPTASTTDTTPRNPISR